MTSQPLHRIVAAIGGLALLLASFTSVSAQQGHGFPASPVAESSDATGAWEVVDQRDLAIDGELVALSPDGQWIAGIGPDGNQFCVWNVETLDPTCDAEEEPIYPESIIWAPDSSAVAYSLNALMQLYDSDIFVFDLDAGASVNLTDDGFRDNIPLDMDVLDGEPLPVDIYPAWSRDGESLIFARTEWNAEQLTTELMTIARDGGDPQSLHTVRDDYPWAVSSPMFALADGSLVYSVWVGDLEDAENGVWRLDADGEATQVMPGDLDATFPGQSLVDARETDAGAVVSGYSRRLAGQMPITGDLSFELNIESGEVSPVHVEAGVMSPLRYSPDGASTVSMEFVEAGRRVIVTAPGGEILDLGDHEVGRYIYSLGFDWASNNTILISGLFRNGTLVTVAQGNEPAATPVSAADEPADVAVSWSVEDQRDLAIEGDPVTMSPDGQWIAGLGEDREFCVWNVETLEPTCEEPHPSSIEADSIRWAPDSTAVAFSYDAWRMGFDSDIFVFEVATGETVNLTDDGYNDSILFGDEDEPDTLLIDIMPTWAPDSQSLTFARTDVLEETPGTDLMTIARSGGEAELRATVIDDFPGAVFFPMVSLADGSLLYSLVLSDISEPDNGIWHLNTHGETVQIMDGSDGGDFPGPAIVDVLETEDGTIISGYSVWNQGQLGASEPTAFYLDVEEGGISPITSGEDPDVRASAVRFSPDGGSTIGLRWIDGDPHLIIEAETGAMDLGIFEGFRYGFSRGADWATNNTIFVSNTDGGGTLLTVAPENDIPPCGCIDPAEG